MFRRRPRFAKTQTRKLIVPLPDVYLYIGFVIDVPRTSKILEDFVILLVTLGPASTSLYL
jgi:hypothetical protein